MAARKRIVRLACCYPFRPGEKYAAWGKKAARFDRLRSHGLRLSEHLFPAAGAVTQIFDFQRRKVAEIFGRGRNGIGDAAQCRWCLARAGTETDPAVVRNAKYHHIGLLCRKFRMIEPGPNARVTGQ